MLDNVTVLDFVPEEESDDEDPGEERRRVSVGRPRVAGADVPRGGRRGRSGEWYRGVKRGGWRGPSWEYWGGADASLPGIATYVAGS